MMFDCGSILKEGGIAFCVLSHMMFGDGSKFFFFGKTCGMTRLLKGEMS